MQKQKTTLDIDFCSSLLVPGGDFDHTFYLPYYRSRSSISSTCPNCVSKSRKSVKYFYALTKAISSYNLLLISSSRKKAISAGDGNVKAKWQYLLKKTVLFLDFKGSCYDKMSSTEYWQLGTSHLDLARNKQKTRFSLSCKNWYIPDLNVNVT